MRSTYHPGVYVLTQILFKQVPLYIGKSDELSFTWQHLQVYVYNYDIIIMSLCDLMWMLWNLYTVRT